MKTQVITLDKKKYRLMPESEYLSIKQDIADLKKVLSRKKEPGMDAKDFFAGLDKKKKN